MLPCVACKKVCSAYLAYWYYHAECTHLTLSYSSLSPYGMSNPVVQNKQTAVFSDNPSSSSMGFAVIFRLRVEHDFLKGRPLDPSLLHFRFEGRPGPSTHVSTLRPMG